MEGGASCAATVRLETTHGTGGTGCRAREEVTHVVATSVEQGDARTSYLRWVVREDEQDRLV